MTNGMRKRAKLTAKQIDEKLAEVEDDLLEDTTFDWKSIKPELADKDEYDRLMQIVDESTQHNESIGQLVNRLQALGEGGQSLLKKVKTFLVS